MRRRRMTMMTMTTVGKVIEKMMTTMIVTMMMTTTIPGSSTCVATDGDVRGNRSTLIWEQTTTWLMENFLTMTMHYIPYGPGAHGIWQPLLFNARDWDQNCL